MPKKSSTSISSFKHQDKRVNIPPQELSNFMQEEENQPKTMLYPRDPSLDPQLVWKGKDEQDREALEVPTVPIYIQEKIQPQAIIENVRAQAMKQGKGVAEAEAAYQMTMFADFNNIKFEDLVEFYQHDQNWSNRMVLGDSLLVMNSLAEKEGLKGRVQMIYMDPPYGIKFGSNWQARLRKRDVKDGAEIDLTREPEQVKAFRDTWELGIHSYLSYMRDRFMVARELLNESGSFFVQIGSENVHLVRCLLDEVFGSENFITQIWFQTKKMSFGATYLEEMGDYLLFYAKNKECVKYRQLFLAKDTENDPHYSYIELPDGSRRTMTKEEKDDRSLLPLESKVFIPLDLRPAGYNASGNFSYSFLGKGFHPGLGKTWKTNEKGMNNLERANRLYPTRTQLTYILYVDDYPVTALKGTWEDTEGAYEPTYVVQTAIKVIQRCILMTTDPGDLVLDPTCGSGTTAHVAEQWGRRWITIDTSRVSVALARMRLMTAKYPYFLLADSPEGKAKEAQVSGVMGAVAETVKTCGDIRQGFVYQRVPHVTLKSIANNEEIDTIYAKWQEQMEPLRVEINKKLGTKYEEWEIPRTDDADTKLPAIARENIEKWWEMRRKRQKEIDDSIARRADLELLYDKPYEDNKRIRVCGPFTVENLSPHRVLSTDVDRAQSEKQAERLESGGKFEQNIIENLRTAGVQNTKKGERLNFMRLDSFAGGYLQASGEYKEAGKTKRVAVCIGPEHGTVGGDLIREASKEAMQGVGFDLLVVLGFAFDPHINEEIKRYGRLMVLPARINPDLMMGDLLKKTKAANLFTVFGEPDIAVKKVGEKIQVELKGVDIFDPTTGEIRSSTTADIACWFIDTDYNGESFFARQAYFTGWDEPYEKLRRALRAEVDEAAWQVLYQTTSMLFDKPKSGKIAVKVINDYGDEVMKVYDVQKVVSEKK